MKNWSSLDDVLGQFNTSTGFAQVTNDIKACVMKSNAKKLTDIASAFLDSCSAKANISTLDEARLAISHNFYRKATEYVMYSFHHPISLRETPHTSFDDAC